MQVYLNITRATVTRSHCIPHIEGQGTWGPSVFRSSLYAESLRHCMWVAYIQPCSLPRYRAKNENIIYLIPPSENRTYSHLQSHACTSAPRRRQSYFVFFTILIWFELQRLTFSLGGFNYFHYFALVTIQSAALRYASQHAVCRKLTDAWFPSKCLSTMFLDHPAN